MYRCWSRRIKLILAAFVLSAAPFLFSSGVNAQDCDDNAVIRCGVSASTLVQKYRENQQGNVQAVFREFGIANEAALSGLVAGRVTSNNEVYVGNKLVATNAITVGRQNMPGSTPIMGGQFYKRPPSVSFRSGSLSALVKMDGETFRYAIIESCGNPVTASDVPNPTPPPPPPPQPERPDFTIQKDVRKKGDTEWMQHVSTRLGELVEFRVTIKNIGDTDLTNVHFRDMVPAGLNSPRLTSQTHDSQAFSTTGISLGSIAKNGQKEIVFEATLDASTQYCGASRLRNVAYAKPDKLPEENDDATVETCVTQTPTPAPTPTPTPPPTVLPDTGAGTVVGLFSVTTLLGAVLHRLKEFYLAKFLK